VATGNGGIVIDSDSAFFGDDGVAVVMLLRSGRASDIRGITMGAGNVAMPDAVRYMRDIVARLEHRPPVFAGAARPLVHTPGMARVEARRWGPLDWTGALAREEDGGGRFESGAVAFLAEAVREHPGRVTILAIGPMTNLALALRTYPDIEPMIEALVFMGGAIHAPGNANRTAEFNFWFDPEAAQIVLRSAIPRKVMFALDVCNTVVLTAAMFNAVVAVDTPITALYRKDFGERFPGFLNNPGATACLWDELAAAYVIDPSIATRSESRLLDVASAFGPDYGRVVALDPELAPAATPVEIVTEVDAAKVFAMYKRALMGEGLGG
jgi:inosine-uridine nucleoside N-ribohydrolase